MNVSDMMLSAWFFSRVVFSGGVPKSLSLFGVEDFIDAKFGSVHLSVDGNLQTGFSFEKREEIFRLVTFAIHKLMNTVAHGMLLLAKRIDTFFRFTADIVDFAFLDGIEITHHFADVMARLFLEMSFMLCTEG